MSNGTLTLQDIAQMLASMWDGEYAMRELERSKQEADGYILLERARTQGIISDVECFWLSQTVAANGGLIVSPAMHERLKQVKP